MIFRVSYTGLLWCCPVIVFERHRAAAAAAALHRSHRLLPLIGDQAAIWQPAPCLWHHIPKHLPLQVCPYMEERSTFSWLTGLSRVGISPVCECERVCVCGRERGKRVGLPYKADRPGLRFTCLQELLFDSPSFTEGLEISFVQLLHRAKYLPMAEDP